LYRRRGVGIWLILPFFWLPKDIFERYILFLHQNIAPILFRKILEDKGHCNCQTIEELTSLLINYGFKIEKHSQELMFLANLVKL